MAISTRPVLVILPERANTLVPLLPPTPTVPNQSAPFATMPDTLARVSTLLMDVGLSNNPAHRGVRRSRPRHAALALDGVDQRRFLAADERARAHLDADFEVEAAVENIVTQEAVGDGLIDGGMEPS